MDHSQEYSGGEDTKVTEITIEADVWIRVRLTSEPSLNLGLPDSESTRCLA